MVKILEYVLFYILMLNFNIIHTSFIFIKMKDNQDVICNFDPESTFHRGSTKDFRIKK
jgi:hypothetical protein